LEKVYITGRKSKKKKSEHFHRGGFLPESVTEFSQQQQIIMRGGGKGRGRDAF